MNQVDSIIDYTGFAGEVGRYGAWLRPGSTAKRARKEVVERLLSGQHWAWVGIADPSKDFLRVFVQVKGGRIIEGRIEFGDERRLLELKEASTRGRNPIIDR